MSIDWADHSKEFQWHQWRAQGIGGSDAPILLGVSPWKDIHSLLLEKTGELDVSGDWNFATQRGKDLEPIVRTKINKVTGLSFQPAQLISRMNPIFRANVDGIYERYLIEIKCPGKIDHGTALLGNIPDKYIPQCQWLMLVSETEVMDYVSWDGKSEEPVVIKCVRDQSMIDKLTERALMFWDLVTQRKEFLVKNKGNL